MPIPAPVKSCILLLIVSAATCAGAQTNGSIWESGKENIQKVKGKATKKLSAFKSWKGQMRKWGLDSNYGHSLAICGRLNSDGWSAGIVYGRKPHGRRLSLWQLTFSEVKDEKETKRQGTNASFPELGSGTPYIFGKINNLYLLNAGYSRERILIRTLLEGNVSIGLRYGGGLSLAMLKPYYLELIYPDYSITPATASLHEEGYSQINELRFLDQNLVLSRGKWSRGLNAITYVPGLYLEAGITIQTRNAKSFIQSVIMGVSGSAYSNNLPITAVAKKTTLKGYLFAQLEFGKHW